MRILQSPGTLRTTCSPTPRQTLTYDQTLADIYDGYAHDASGSYPTTMPASSASGFSGSGAPNTYSVSVDGYGSMAAAAIAMSNGVAGQSSAWAVISPWQSATFYYNHDPRYAILPRS